MWKRSCTFVSVVAVGLTSWGCALKEEAPAAPPRKAAGEVCRVASECQGGFACADRVCVRVPRQANESCGEHAACGPGLICQRSAVTERKTWEAEDYEPSDTYGDHCLTPEGLAAELAHAERVLLEKSGLSEEEIDAKMTVAEAPTVATGPGLPVRVVRTESKVVDERGTVFAVCRDSERLVSGSCGRVQGDDVLRRHVDDPEVGVTGHSDSDTVGARWTCVGKRGDTVIAKALCQALPMATSKP